MSQKTPVSPVNADLYMPQGLVCRAVTRSSRLWVQPGLLPGGRRGNSQSVRVVSTENVMSTLIYGQSDMDVVYKYLIIYVSVTKGRIIRVYKKVKAVQLRLFLFFSYYFKSF